MHFKVWIYQHVVLPRVQCPLVIYKFSKLKVKNMERKISEYLRRWFRLPRFLCSTGLYGKSNLIQFPFHGLVEVLYNYRMIFLYKSFFVNYILSFSLVGLWTIRLLVQVHRHWVQFTFMHRGYDNHNYHNKPQIGKWAGVWMMPCPEAMGWEFGYFEKHVS